MPGTTCAIKRCQPWICVCPEPFKPLLPRPPLCRNCASMGWHHPTPQRPRRGPPAWRQPGEGQRRCATPQMRRHRNCRVDTLAASRIDDRLSRPRCTTSQGLRRRRQRIRRNLPATRAPTIRTPYRPTGNVIRVPGSRPQQRHTGRRGRTRTIPRAQSLAPPPPLLSSIQPQRRYRAKLGARRHPGARPEP